MTYFSVFMLKNEKSLLSCIILLYETILRGPGKFRVPASKNSVTMNLVIKPSRSRKAHPNWVTEKQLTADYGDVDRVLEREVWLSTPRTCHRREPSQPLRLGRQRKKWFLELERAVPCL